MMRGLSLSALAALTACFGTDLPIDITCSTDQSTMPRQRLVIDEGAQTLAVTLQDGSLQSWCDLHAVKRGGCMVAVTDEQVTVVGDDTDLVLNRMAGSGEFRAGGYGVERAPLTRLSRCRPSRPAF